ncbi:hypothetical protein SCALM49S_06126 [Streptomyces californicus]
MVPGATESEAARALKEFTAAYNAADKAHFSIRRWTRTG